MTNARLEQLLGFLKDDPDDPFTIYAIATEYLNIDLQKARQYFEILLQQHPDYVATYYHAAHLYADLDMPDKAGATFEKGIEKAQLQNDALALRELRSAYEQFRFEEDDD